MLPGVVRDPGDGADDAVRRDGAVVQQHGDAQLLRLEGVLQLVGEHGHSDHRHPAVHRLDEPHEAAVGEERPCLGVTSNRFTPANKRCYRLTGQESPAGLCLCSLLINL